jgi:hypothetical protein
VLPPGIAHGDYDDSYYKPDNDPTAPDTDNVPNQIIASRPDFHRLAGDITYADPSGAGKPAKFVPSGGRAAGRVRQVQPVHLGCLFWVYRSQRLNDAVDVRHRQSRHGSRLPDAGLRRAPGASALSW